MICKMGKIFWNKGGGLWKAGGSTTCQVLEDTSIGAAYFLNEGRREEALEAHESWYTLAQEEWMWMQTGVAPKLAKKLPRDKAC